MSDLIERAKAAQDAVLSSIGGTFGAQRQSASDARYALEDLMRALIDTTAERDALRERVARLEAALELYSCEDGCNDCPEHERDRVSCGWTALTALQEDTPNG